MSDAIYETKNGDVLDAICHRHYGKIDGNLERVLAANPGLADQGPVLPRGVRITLPALPEARNKTPILKTIRLWD